MERDKEDIISLATNTITQKQYESIIDNKSQQNKIFSWLKMTKVNYKNVLGVVMSLLLIFIIKLLFHSPQQIRTIRMDFINDDEQIQIIIEEKPKPLSSFIFKDQLQANVKQFPQILWVHTERQLNGQRMIEQITARNWIHWGKKSNFEVRIVNNFNAYEWLSKEMIQIIKYIKQSSKYGTSVYPLLKLALLIEHGGLYLKINDALMIDNFPPINSYLQKLLQGHEDEIFLKKNSPQIILFYHNGKKRKIFADEVIYSKTNSKLMRDVLQKVRIILLNGQWPYKQQEGLQYMVSGSKVTYIHNIIYHAINANYRYYYSHSSQFIHKYKVLSLDINNNSISRYIQKKTFLDEAVKDENLFFKKYGNISIVITKPVILQDLLFETFYTSSIKLAGQSSIYANKIVNTQHNKWILDYVDLQRPIVQFCIISLKVLGQFNYEKLINQSLVKLKEQKYTNWQAIYFVQNFQQHSKKYSDQPNVTIISSSLQQGLDFQRAIIFYCRPKSIAVVLNYDQYFTESNALDIAKKYFTDVGVYGAYVATQTNQVLYENKFGNKKIRRVMLEPNQQLYDDIANHFRFLSIQSYRFLSHGNLHDDQHGRYFNTVIPFLALLQFFWNYDLCYKGQLGYHLKKVNRYYEIPKYRLTINSIIIKAPERIKVRMKTFQYFNKYPAQQFCNSVREFLNYKKRPIEEFFILNNGVQFKGLKSRKNREMIIPKKIHQIWIGGPIPQYKQFIMGKNKENHPDYEYYLWGEANITKKNFPNSYYLLKKLLQYNKYNNKLAEVEDLMKHQLLYRNGGFYLDTNYMTLRPHSLDQWRTFKAIFVSHYQPRQRLERYSGLIGSVKQFKNLERVINHSVIDTIDYYSNETSIEAGPLLLSEAIRGQQYYDLQIFQPSFDYIYPFTVPHNFLCEAPNDLPQDQILFKNKKTYYKNCSSIYYYAFGVDFFSQGFT